MNKFAVLRLSGKQYKVSEGQEILVDKMSDSKAEPEVLLYADGETVGVGKPLLKNSKVELKVVSQEEKGEKVDVYKYKSKSRYRKHIGFRPKMTRIKIGKITLSK